MKIGYLRNRLTIQQMQEFPDENVGVVRGFINLSIVWGSMEPIKNGSVYFLAQQINENITHKVRIRYYPGLTTENWIYFDFKRYRIKFIKNIYERDRWQELLCEEDQQVFPDRHPLLMLFARQA